VGVADEIIGEDGLRSGHDEGCRCDDCRLHATAIVVKNSDGAEDGDSIDTSSRDLLYAFKALGDSLDAQVTVHPAVPLFVQTPCINR
jgi:hypothetical protein